MTVKILLKQVRATRKLSQNKLAQLMGMSLQNIQRIEYGDAKSIPLETLDKLCEVLKCQPGDLLIRVSDGDTETSTSVSSHHRHSTKAEMAPTEDNPSNQCQYRQSWLKALSPIPESA